jgi:hypothetical protein
MKILENAEPDSVRELKIELILKRKKFIDRICLQRCLAK